MGFLKKMKKAAHKVEAAVEKAADTATHPTELRDLDAIVKDLTTKLDVAILQFENDGTPPNADQAKEWEDAQFAEQFADYDARAKKTCGRGPKDDKDNIAVRRRILNRNHDARRGKLFARFSGDVAALKESAEAAMNAADVDLAETVEECTARLPIKPTEVTEAFTGLLTRVEDNINASFPGGVEGLDNYDDGMDCKSYEEWKTAVMAAQEEMLAANAEAVGEAIAEYKQGVFDSILGDLADDEIEFVDDGGEAIKNEIIEAVKGALGISSMD